MFRKITTIAAAALAVGSLTVAPPVAQAAPIAPATVTVTASVGSAASIATKQNASTSAWDGTTPTNALFIVTVISNDTSGYSFTFTGANDSAGTVFNVVNAVGAITVPYTIIAVDGTDSPSTYLAGVTGLHSYGGGTLAASPGLDSSFNVGLPGSGSVATGFYRDTLTVAINEN
jgi:hypothetical protein